MSSVPAITLSLAVILLSTACARPGSSAGGSMAASTDRASPHARPLTIAQQLNGMHFVSKEQGEGGLGPHGPVLRHYRVSFKDGIVTWDYSDVQQGGRYQVAEDGTITAFVGGTITAFYDRDKGELLWVGMWYAPEPKPRGDGARHDSE